MNATAVAPLPLALTDDVLQRLAALYTSGISLAEDLLYFVSDSLLEARLAEIEPTWRKLKVCRLCGWKGRSVANHVRAKHPEMPLDEYRRSFHYNEKTALCSEITSKKISKNLKDRGPLSAKHRKRLAESAKKRAARQRGRSRPEMRVRGDQNPVSKFAIACLLVCGHSYDAAAERLDRFHTTIGNHARKMGLAGSTVYSFGDRIDAAALLRVLRVSGLPAKEFASQVGISVATIYEYQKARKRDSRIFAPEVARRISAWRDKLVRHLLCNTRGWRGSTTVSRFDAHAYGPSRVLKTFFPDLRAKYHLLCRVLRHCRGYLRANPDADGAALGEYLCEQATLDKGSKGSGQSFARFVLWAPELMPVLEANLDRLRDRGNEKWPSVGHEILAAFWGTTPAIVRNAFASRKIHPIPPEEMRRLLTLARANGGRAAEKRSRGPRKAESDKEYFKAGQQVEQAIPIFGALFKARDQLPGTIQRNRLALQRELAKLGFTEQQIDVARTSRNGDALVAARRFVSIQRDLGLTAVAAYHRDYKAVLSKLAFSALSN